MVLRTHSRQLASVSSTIPAIRSILRSEEHTSELQSQSNLVCRLLLEKKKKEKIVSSISANTVDLLNHTTEQRRHTYCVAVIIPEIYVLIGSHVSSVVELPRNNDRSTV